jgi:solute carrier family 25 uncoupling protein 8/9
MRSIVEQEGVRSLYKGFWPAIHRQLVFASLRVSLYRHITGLFVVPGEAALPLSTKVLAGLASGAIGILVANPTDLVKVRMQSEGRLAAGQAPRYTGVLNAYSTIVKQEGLRGLWTGIGPAVMRNSIINATEMASYDTAKEALIGQGMKDGLPVQFGAGLAAGLMATLVGSPVDLVKTRVMAARSLGAASGAPAYSGAIDCIVKTLRHEGPGAFYKGVVPQFYRLTTWSVVMFVAFEQLKGVATRVLDSQKQR